MYILGAEKQIVYSKKQGTLFFRQITKITNFTFWTMAKFGVAFSGGGIRSAALCSGVLRRLLQKKASIHYLSCVSGGGYTGTSYLDWKYRNGREDDPKWHQEYFEHLRTRSAIFCNWQKPTGLCNFFSLWTKLHSESCDHLYQLCNTCTSFGGYFVPATPPMKFNKVELRLFPEPCAELYYLQLNFKIPKLVYCQSTFSQLFCFRLSCLANKHH